MNGLSPWASAVDEIFSKNGEPPLFSKTFPAYEVNVYCRSTTLWVAVTCPKNGLIVVRAAYTPTGSFTVTKKELNEQHCRIRLKSPVGSFEVHLRILQEDGPMLRCTTTLEPAYPLLIPFWPRDLIIAGTGSKRNAVKGKIHVSQVGARTGLQFIGLEKPDSGSLLYLQNLTALNAYCQETGTSACDTVGGLWPELGFALPPTKEKPLPAGKAITLSDAFLSFTPESHKDELALSKQYLNLLAGVYVHLPRPDTEVRDWPGILQKGLHDLTTNHACWLHRKGRDYLNAYVCDYATPPELMVQLAVLAPLIEYKRWCNEEFPVVEVIRSGMETFYDEKIGSVVRWLPSMSDDLDESEEQLKPNVMDSWYLHHPMLNLCRLAQQGDKKAEELFLKSVPFTIRVARHFRYNWPVFYNMETLEVVKAESSPGKGGEKDVAGLYALVMMHAFELTKERKYLEEAERAAKTLKKKGFQLFYQANNTAFSAKAMLRLYKETKDETYLDLSYQCLAGIMKNVQLWECDYGFAKNYSTFFGVFPLNDAPYTAAYEEQEVFASLHDYLVQAEELDILPAVRLLLAEEIRYLVHRAVFYYPSNLPKEMLSEEVKMGEVDPGLWIALEDLYDGWEPAGKVGQEVYGAGVAFGIVPRHYHRVKDQPFQIYSDYPIFRLSVHKNATVSFRTGGDERLTCRMMILSTVDKKLSEFTLTGKKGASVELYAGKELDDRRIEFTIPGDRLYTLSWS